LVTHENGVSVWRAEVPAKARFFRAYLEKLTKVGCQGKKMKRNVFLLQALMAVSSLAVETDRASFGPLSPSAQPYERTYIWPEGRMPDVRTNQVAAKTGEIDRPGFRAEDFRRPYIDWYAPAASNRTDTCVLFVSGGGFMCCCDAERLQPAIDRFVRAGITVANLTYRTPRPVGLPIYQSAWADTQRAVRVMRSEAKRRGFSPERIGATGISAGAKAVLLLALSSKTPAYERIDDLDDLPCNLQFALPQAPAYVLDDGSDRPNARRGVGAAIVPELAFDDATCPLCLLQGGTDEYSPLGSVRLYQRLRRMGIPAELHLFADRWHGFHGDADRSDDGTAWDHWCDRMLAFVGRFEPKLHPERYVWSLPQQSAADVRRLEARAKAYAPVYVCGSESPDDQQKMAEAWEKGWTKGEQCDLHLESGIMDETARASRICEFLNHLNVKH